MHVRAKKNLGQNFLRDPGVVKRIVDALDTRPEETIVEIGPGLGALTTELLERGSSVIAIEFDRDMVAHLRDRFAGNAQLEVRNEDALSVDLSSLATGDPVKLVANLPYNISTPILQRFIREKDIFGRLVLMFQREVVDRLIALPGNSDRGYLTVLTENAFDIRKLFDVPPGAFQPVPKVWSSVVILEPRQGSPVSTNILEPLVSAAFRQKRKTIANNLKQAFEDVASVLSDAGIDGRRRAETLSLNEWHNLAISIKKAGQ